MENLTKWVSENFRSEYGGNSTAMASFTAGKRLELEKDRPEIQMLQNQGESLAGAQNPLNRLLTAIYMPALRTALRFPKSVLLAALLILAIGIRPIDKIGSEFIPSLDEGDLMYMPTTYPGISVGKARELLQQTDKLIRTIPEVKTVFRKV